MYTVSVISQYQRWIGLNTRNLCIVVCEAEKPMIGVPADSVFGEDSISGLQMAAFLLCHHLVERENLSGLFSY